MADTTPPPHPNEWKKVLRSLGACLIAILHLVLVVYVVLGPWTSDKHVLLLYIMSIPFIQLHWLTNNDTCALTVAECLMRGVPPQETFFHRLVGPVYNLHRKVEDLLLWIFTTVLWLIAISRYYSTYHT